MLLRWWAAPISATVINVLTSWLTHGTGTGGGPPSGNALTISGGREPPSTRFSRASSARPGTGPAPAPALAMSIGDISYCPSIR